MLKKIIFAVILIIFLLVPAKTFSLLYVGVGGDYIIPLAKLNDVNLDAYGFNLQLESRTYCKLWYGLRFDYIWLDPKLPVTENYYESMLLISPKVRYNFLPGNCFDYTGKIAPYLQGMLSISSIDGTDKKNLMGFGGAVGGGLALGFQLFKTCMMFDLNALYSAPNFIARADGRPSLQMINFNISLSVGL